jgi:hypothetical protein
MLRVLNGHQLAEFGGFAILFGMALDIVHVVNTIGCGEGRPSRCTTDS